MYAYIWVALALVVLFGLFLLGKIASRLVKAEKNINILIRDFGVMDFSIKNNNKNILKAENKFKNYEKSGRSFTEVLRKLTDKLGYRVMFDEIRVVKINKEGVEHYGEGKERGETERGQSKKKES